VSFLPPGARAFLFALLSAAALRATTVVAPTFPELVAEAQTIVRAKVTGIESGWVAGPQGRVIKTYVSLAVLRTLKGTPTSTLTLEILGGEINGESMRVQGMPQFVVGDTDIVFVAGNGLRFSPFVGMMHGRYRVQLDPASGREFIARNDRVPLTSIDDVSLPQAGALVAAGHPVGTALTPAAFETRIANELSRRATLP
jgi:hypothetical protein